MFINENILIYIDIFDIRINTVFYLLKFEVKCCIFLFGFSQNFFCRSPTNLINFKKINRRICVKDTIKRRKYRDNPYKILNKGNIYFICFIDNKNRVQEIEVNSKIYDVFNQSELHDLSELNEYDRHIEHSNLIDSTLLYRKFDNIYSLEEEVEASVLSQELYKAIDKLSKIQKRRIVMYYFDDLKLREIAKIEKCSIASVKESIDSALINLRKKIKK